MPRYQIGGKVNLEVDVMGKYAGKATESMKTKVQELENRGKYVCSPFCRRNRRPSKLQRIQVKGKSVRYKSAGCSRYIFF